MQRVALPVKNRVTGRTKTGRRQDGQALAEYAYIIMLIALVCVGVVTLLGYSLRDIIVGLGQFF